MPQELTTEYNMRNYLDAIKGLDSITYTLVGTSTIESIDNLFVIDEVEIDISEKLLEDVNVMQSINKARQEMRRGAAYFSHRDGRGGGGCQCADVAGVGGGRQGDAGE